MTTNETPYRPQVGDRVQVLDDGMILMDWGQGKGPYFVKFKDDCYWMPSEEFQLISRADGVPVETNAREKMQQERAAEVAELKRDLEIARNERNQARLNEQKKWSDVVKSMQDEVDELRRQLAEKTAECERAHYDYNGVTTLAAHGLELRRKQAEDLSQRLDRAVEIATESREFISDIVPGCSAGHDILSSLKQRIDAFLAAESQRTTDGK